MKSLETVLEYKNEEVVFRFSRYYNIEIEECRDIFTETKKWLWLCAYHSNDPMKAALSVPTLSMIEANIIIDEMWHNFICFTNDYNDFCINHFGAFIHHEPARRVELSAVQIMGNHETETEADFESQLQYIFNVLGAETLVKWYETYPEKYSRNQLKLLFKQWD